MRSLCLLFILISIAGCAGIAEQTDSISSVSPVDSSTLYTIRIEQSDTTRFSGLLAIEPRTDGMWTILLDATGIPLLKGLVRSDGTLEMAYCVDALRSGGMPDLLSRIIEYTYFLAARHDCPWYAPYRVCFSRDEAGSLVKWQKIGPFNPWVVKRQLHEERGETITMHLKIPPVRVTLQHLAEEKGN